MISITDPSELKPADVYRQARLISSKTSRGSDRNWYRDAFELDHQWHLWFDGGREVVSATFSRLENTWRPGPSLLLASLTTGDGLEDILGELISPKFFGQRPRAVGVILHVADEFALATLQQSSEAGGESEEDIGILRYNLVDDPREVLADREVSPQTTAWRLLPFWGAAQGQPTATAMALSRSRELFLGKLLTLGEELRLPIRVAVTAGALECLAALPLIQPDLTGGRLIVIPYQKFTVVFVINHAGELRSVRSLAHRANAFAPAGLGDILLSMAVSAELAGQGASGQPPRVLLASGHPNALMAATKELESYSMSRQTIQWEMIDFTTHAALTGIPGNRPEFLAYDPALIQERTRSGTCVLANTETFSTLWRNWLTGSSFFNTARLDALYPAIQDLRLLKFSTALISLLVLALVGTAGYGVYTLYQAVNHPSWNLTQDELSRTIASQTKLQNEQRQIALTERLFQPRSRAWTTLDFLLQLFPEDAAIRLENFDYTVDATRTSVASAKSAAPAAKTKAGAPPAATTTTGFVRTWTLKGLAKPQAQELLSTLNSQRGLAALFEQVAKATGDSSYTPDPSRLLTVALTQSRNNKFVPDSKVIEGNMDPASSYPFTFEAVISQTITDKDVLAIPADKPF